MKTLQRMIRPEQIRELSLIFIIALVVVIFGSQINDYYSNRTFTRVSASIAIITVVAVGQTLVVLTRNVDLSVGSIVGFTAYFVGQQFKVWDMSPIQAVALAMGVGALMGLINGLLVAYGNIPAIVVTLGTLAIYRGFLVEYSNAQTVTTDRLPKWLVDLPRQDFITIGGLDIRLLVALALVVVVIFQLILSFTTFGRRLYAIGSNPDAAKIAGIPSRRLVTIAFTLCGSLAGLGGFMFLARFGNITVVAAQGLELQVIAAAVVGGVNIFGGSGTVLGAMLGAVLIGLLEQSLIRMRINPFWKDATLGLLILLAVIADAVILNRLRNLWARAELKERLTEEN